MYYVNPQKRENRLNSPAGVRQHHASRKKEGTKKKKKTPARSRACLSGSRDE